MGQIYYPVNIQALTYSTLTTEYIREKARTKTVNLYGLFSFRKKFQFFLRNTQQITPRRTDMVRKGG